MNSLDGKFWVDPEVTVPGTFTLDVDGTFLLELQGYVFWPEQLDRTNPNNIAQSDDPAKIVADFWPRDIMGILASDEPISLLGALMEQPSGSIAQQRFKVPSFVRGAHIQGRGSPVEGLRWRWNVLPGRAGWAASPSAQVTGLMAGELSSWSDDQTAGLQINLDEVRPFETVLTQTREYSNQLIALSCVRDSPRAVLTEVRVDGAWYEYETPEDPPPPLPSSNLVPLENLTVEVFSNWLPVARTIDPFPFIVNNLTKTLQLDTLMLGTLLEGLHRRLHDKDRPLIGVSRNGVKKMVTAAREAALSALEAEGYTDKETADKLLRDTLSHVNQPSYQARAEVLLKPVLDIAPSLFGPDLADWVRLTKQIRNDQSHQLFVDFDERAIEQYYVIMQSCKWAVTLRILLQIFPSDLVQHALTRSNAFEFALANIDREHFWTDYLTLNPFREGRDVEGSG